MIKILNTESKDFEKKLNYFLSLRKNYSSVKEFLITVLHEIKHALDAQKLGHKKFKKKYDQAGTMAAHGGLDPHDDNKWEKRAENWAKKEVKKWIDKFQNQEK